MGHGECIQRCQNALLDLNQYPQPHPFGHWGGKLACQWDDGSFQSHWNSVPRWTMDTIFNGLVDASADMRNPLLEGISREGIEREDACHVCACAVVCACVVLAPCPLQQQAVVCVCVQVILASTSELAACHTYTCKLDVECDTL